MRRWGKECAFVDRRRDGPWATSSSRVAATTFTLRVWGIRRQRRVEWGPDDAEVNRHPPRGHTLANEMRELSQQKWI